MNTLPHEILALILHYLPIQGSLLRALASTSRCLSRVLLQDPAHAIQHVRDYANARVCRGIGCLPLVCAQTHWDAAWLQEHWHGLPFAYKASLFVVLTARGELGQMRTCVCDGRVAKRVVGAVLDREGVYGGDVMVRDGQVLMWAVESGHVEVVRILVNRGRLPLEAVWLQKAFKVACRRNWVDIVELLLKVEGLDPGMDNDWCLVTAVSLGHMRLFQVLVQDRRTDIAAQNQECIITAVNRGNSALLSMILQNPRVDTNARDCHAMHVALARGHTTMVEILAQDHRTQVNEETVRFAMNMGQMHLVETLLQDRVLENEFVRECLSKAQARRLDKGRVDTLARLAPSRAGVEI
ncbi:hypothetical protein BC830DRAFT_1167399 [Chytriomyces sp. MP71]|nr:hypothetical protein BC830DRAFT_1167399 [Chytriomyces sp. MP71]